MLYLCPEKIWQEYSSNISKLHSLNTVLYQRTLQGRQSTHKSEVLFPPSGSAASSVRWKVSLFNYASSHLLTETNPHITTHFNTFHQDWVHSLSFPSLQHQRQILRQLYKTTMNIITQYVEIKCQLDATDDTYCRSYCLLNMFRAPLCPSSGAREYYTDGRCLWYLVLWFSSCRYGVELRICRLLQAAYKPDT